MPLREGSARASLEISLEGYRARLSFKFQSYDKSPRPVSRGMLGPAAVMNRKPRRDIRSQSGVVAIGVSVAL
jgi:hypothetical protein